ncbi:uncharacterized protein LOC141837331 [Curcuma longa]|uniref:uncharacterized protein LOC141837331 n=1 Tax=Curcuma longa TaxID=136217 RepID=UPI003D9E22E4
MKVLYYADLNELHQRISLKLRQNDALTSAKAAEQFEKMKGFKMMLERTLQILLISKANISPSMKDKIPLYEKQIQNILASNKKKGIPSQAPGQQQFQHPRSHSQLVQQQQQTQISQLQQHDNYANQQNNIQGSSNSMQTPAVQNIQHGSVPLSAHFGVTSQQKISNALQTGSTVDPVQGNSFSSLQQGAIAPMQQGGLVMPIAPMQRSSSNVIQLQHFKQEQQHLMSNPQLKQQLQQRHVQQHLLQQQQKKQLLQAQQPLQQHVQQQQQKQHQTSQMPLHQMQQLHQSNEVSDLKLRQAPGIKPGLYQQHYSTTQRHGYYQVKPATLDSIAPTGHVAIADLQEEIYQKIRSMKDLYYADLNELHQRICLKLQQNDALPSAKAEEQFEKMKGASLNDDPSPPNTDEFVGKRRVELYDLDYDIFRRATPRARGALPLTAKSPAKESGWTRLRREFASKGLKELTKAVLERRVFDDEGLQVSDTVPSPGSFSMESSATPSSSTADTASILSTFSPNSSSSSDWYNLSPPSSELYRIRQPEPNSDLQSSVTGNVKWMGSRTLVERRGDNAPLVLSPSSVDASGRLSSTELVMDWCPSPPFISEVEEDQEALDIGQLSLDASDQDVSAEDAPSAADEDTQLIHPVLFRWPDMDKVDAHHGVLNSDSVFLLLASESKAGSRKPMIKIYVWLGRNSRQPVHVDRIGTKFIELMGIPLDTTIQVIREGEEPEQFLNHLFSFHQAKEGIH